MQDVKSGNAGPGNIESKKKPERRILWASLGLSAAALTAAMAFQMCSGGPATETINKDAKPKVVTVCPPPSSTDVKCELGKGEGDPLLGIRDPVCPICGDGKLTPPETAKTCPVDDLCGNKQPDKGSYPGMVGVEGMPGIYMPGVVVVDECAKDNAFYCEKDCPPKEQPKRHAGRRTPSGQDDSGSDRCKPSVCEKSTLGPIRSALFGAVDEGKLREKCPDGAITVAGNFRVTSAGVVSQTNRTLTAACKPDPGCDSESTDCKNTSMTWTINVEVVLPESIAAPGGCGCTTTTTVPVAKVATAS